MSLEGSFLLLFAIGASFFLISFLLGEFLHGADTVIGDVAHDVFHIGSPTDGGDDSVSPFSLRTVMMFLTGFSAVGYISRHFGSPGWLAFVFGALVGFAAAWMVYKLLSLLAKYSARRNWRIDDAWGQEAEVIVRIEPEGLGKILVTVHGQVVNFPAKSNEKMLLPQGARVTIVDIDRERGVATVASSS